MKAVDIFKKPLNIAVLGAGPAGSFFTIFVLQMVKNLKKEVEITIFDRKTFRYSGPKGCNMCAGVIGNNLITYLRDMGLPLPDRVIRRDIQGYTFHTKKDSVTLLRDVNSQIYGVFRGGGPPDEPPQNKRTSFDQHLLDYAVKQGANFFPEEVKEIEFPIGLDDKILVKYGDGNQLYRADLIIGAFGVNSTLMRKFNFGYLPPKTWHTCQAEIKLEAGYIRERLKDTIHIFPVYNQVIKFITITPKDEYITVTAIGRHVKIKDLKEAMMTSKIMNFLPPQWEISCHCHPRIPVTPSRYPYTDRLIIIGDASYSRYLKNGIESALHTSYFAAQTALEKGVSGRDLKRFYDRRCRRRFVLDNIFGKFIFRLHEFVLRRKLFFQPYFEVLKREQGEFGVRERRLSWILWNMFSGEAPYREIFWRGLNPKLQASLTQEFFRIIWHFIWNMTVSIRNFWQKN